jgi:hypothetical protein
MKITIENTTKIVKLDDVPARIWEGETDSGVKVICYITRIAVADGEDHEQFRRELLEQRTPSAEVQAIPLRLII